MMEWLTVNQAAVRLLRSPNTIAGWIKRSSMGRGSLLLRRKVNGDGEEIKGWLVEASSLKEMNRKAVEKRGRLAKQSLEIETDHRVRRDRKKYVEVFIKEGKPLRRILKVFDRKLHSEVEGYYYKLRSEGVGYVKADQRQ